MRKILKIAGNELRALFCSPVAWFILVIFAVQSGMTFTDLFRSVLRQQFMGEPIEYSITTALLTGMSGTFTVIQQYLYLYVPLLTMGLMSREFGSGSIKLLYSSPVTAGQIIWGKFLSMMVYGLILMGVLLVLVLFACCTVESFDLSAALSGLLGLYLLMCAYAAIGLYMSSLTSYQVVAAVGTLAVLIVLNFIGSVGQDIAFVREITYWLSIKGRATVFIDGLICSEDFLYFVVVILFFLTLGIMKIEAHRAKRSQVMTVGRYLVVIAVTVALGYMTSRPTFLWYYDATASKTQTLTKESQSILERMKDDLTIVTYVNLLGDNSSYGMPRSLKSDMENFKPYIRFKSNIELKYVYYYKKASSYIRERYANVLITGENGTGKEIVAREIHALSGRKGEVMISVDMGAITETLFESELFGHVKGAFTDAREDRVGKFEAANKGTLFLDEIGNLSYALQSKLLATLQSRKVIRVGSNKPIDVNIRLICATNSDLPRMVKEGTFREDLLYRINTIHVEVPPLRERGNDILLLAEAFLRDYGRKYRKPDLSFSGETRQRLLGYSWPGNVRELQHTVEKAVIMCDRQVLTPEDFLFKSEPGEMAPLETLEDMEREMIRKALERHEGNLSAVASRLGITRQTLYNKMKKFNL